MKNFYYVTIEAPCACANREYLAVVDGQPYTEEELEATAENLKLETVEAHPDLFYAVEDGYDEAEAEFMDDTIVDIQAITEAMFDEWANTLDIIEWL